MYVHILNFFIQDNRNFRFEIDFNTEYLLVNHIHILFVRWNFMQWIIKRICMLYHIFPHIYSITNAPVLYWSDGCTKLSISIHAWNMIRCCIYAYLILYNNVWNWNAKSYRYVLYLSMFSYFIKFESIIICIIWSVLISKDVWRKVNTL